MSRQSDDRRLALARSFREQGFNAFKYAAVVSFDGIVEEMRALREGLGEGVLVASPKLCAQLQLPAGCRLRFSWVEELSSWILNWGATNKDGAFAQALIYTLLRIRATQELRKGEAA